MEEKIVVVPWQKLHNFMKQVLMAMQVPAEDAQICSDVLIAADIAGIESHGINRLKIYVDRIKESTQSAITNWKVVQDQQSATVIDGGNGMGHVVAYHAMQMAIEKAKKYGCGISVVRNSTHFGIAGYYSNMAVLQNQIGITVTNARPSIAPTFGVEPMLGTNPISFAIPSDLPYPFSLDMATSIIQRGKIEVCDKLGKPTPEGLVIDQKGEYVTDSKAILQGLVQDTMALLPLGGMGESTSGYKGYGLATMVEILSAALSNASYLKNTSGVKDGQNVPLGLGHFFMAIDIAHFIDIGLCRSIVGNIMRGLQNSRKEPGQTKIYVAGEKEYLARLDRTANGIPINASNQKMIHQLQRDLKIADQLL